MTISPTSATLSEGDSKQFTASASATWSASCGSVSSSGLYVAPLVAGACTVTATPTAGGAAASASVTVTSPIVITPQTASTPQNSTQQFTANMPVNWASSCGSISGSGLFTASGPTGVCTITATASTGTAYTGNGFRYDHRPDCAADYSCQSFADGRTGSAVRLRRSRDLVCVVRLHHRFRRVYGSAQRRFLHDHRDRYGWQRRHCQHTGYCDVSHHDYSVQRQSARSEYAVLYCESACFVGVLRAAPLQVQVCLRRPRRRNVHHHSHCIQRSGVHGHHVRHSRHGEPCALEKLYRRNRTSVQ